MNKIEQELVNNFFKDITNGPNRFLIQPPGEDKHKMVVTIEHVCDRFRDLVKKIEEIESVERD